MSNTTITKCFRVDDVLTDPTSIVFSDPTGTYGVRNQVNQEIAVADGVALQQVSTGIYTLEFTDLRYDLTYKYYIEIVYASETFYFEGTKVGTVSPSATGSYILQTDIENVFGEDNIARWSQLDNEVELADINRIGEAIVYTESYINDRLRKSQYIIPFASVPITVKNWCVVKAGAWLYQARGIRDDNDEEDLINAKLEKIETEISGTIMGILQLDAPVKYTDKPSGPINV